MKNITLSAQEDSIEKARKVAAEKNSTLNSMFREWLKDVGDQQINNSGIEDRLNNLWGRTGYARVGRKITRDEMNER